jgi:hypothetical protein
MCRRPAVTMNYIQEKTQVTPDRDSQALQLVLDAIEKLRFGSIHLTLHDGRLVQVDVTERSRFTNQN